MPAWGGAAAHTTATDTHTQTCPPHTNKQFQDEKGVELPLIRHGEPGSLVLVDGSVHQGFSFGASAPIAGEVVFNTGQCVRACGRMVIGAGGNGMHACMHLPAIDGAWSHSLTTRSLSRIH